MKIEKIASLIICTLMIATILPVAGSAMFTSDTTSLNTPPTPAYASMPAHMPDVKNAPYHDALTVTSMSDIVISMLDQVDASTFLSYEQNLTSLGPRPTGSASCIAAATYIHDQFQSMGLPVRYAHWSNGGYNSDNVEATINGTNTTSDAIYIICAHYDTVSAGPGADDDTSGTVAVLMAASIMSQYQFNYTIKFVTFSGEEQGLLGSAVYASQAASQDWNIVGVLNADMISYAVTTSDGNNLIVYENTPSEWLYTYTLDINAEYAAYTQLTLHHGGSVWGSDHNSFWDNGYDALFYFEYTETPYYHTAQDTMAHINASYAVKNIRLILATLAELSEAGLKSTPPSAPEISGPTSGSTNFEYTYSAVSTDPDGDNVYYFFDWGDGTNSGWLGPYASGQTVSTQKSWSDPGTYSVRAKAKDINQVTSPWSPTLQVIILTDQAPSVPSITGSETGKPGASYLFSFSATDPEGDSVYYMIDWGDNTTSDWLGPYISGATAGISHTWTEKGTYVIRAKAKDVYGMESDWGTLQVKMPISNALGNIHLFTLLERFFERYPNAFPILQQLLGM